jgi:hypothetical protein
MFIPISQSKSFKQALLAGALLLTSTGVSFADYNAGSSAFNGGNYARHTNSNSQRMAIRWHRSRWGFCRGRGVVADNTAAYMYDLSPAMATAAPLPRATHHRKLMPTNLTAPGSAAGGAPTGE